MRDRLSRPALAPLRDELVRRWESSEAPVAVVTLHGLPDASRHALADLLGLDHLPPADWRVSVARVAAALGTDPDGLRAALGPLRNLAADRRARAASREALWRWLRASCGPGLDGWVARLRAKGVVGGDVDAFRARLASAGAVLRRLPLEGATLAGLACDLSGDPHALDHGTWLGTTVLDALSERAGEPAPATAEDARRLWASVGVAADALSSSVLVLGLRPDGDDPVASFLRACADASEPASVTEAQLRRWPVRAAARIVYAFENPSMLAEAAATRWTGPPLVCTSGWPNVAVLTLLRQLVDAGATVRYHGDFDAKGLEIAQMLSTRVGVEPWRMTAADYEAAARRARVAISGAIPDVDWDPALAPAMRSRGFAVFEEDLRRELLASAQAT